MIGDGPLAFEISYDQLPFHPNALDMYRKGETTGSNKGNRKLATGRWRLESNRTNAEEDLLFDPQTSGGLVFAVPESEVAALVDALKSAGVESACRIGRVLDSDNPLVRVV